MRSRALALASTLVSMGIFAGCLGQPSETLQAGGNIGGGGQVTTARFEVRDLAFVRLDGTEGPLHEDDGGAIVRYRIHAPADAAAPETAFVTFLFNERIVDVQQVTLEPGASREFTRKVGDLRDHLSMRVEVRAGSAVAKASAAVLEWPRAGADTLEIGPMRTRIDYGLMEQDGRVLVNISLGRIGPADAPFADFRAKMLCAPPDGTIRATTSVRLPLPEAGTSTSIDALLDDCGSDLRYAVEFKARAGGDELASRLLLVGRGWHP